MLKMKFDDGGSFVGDDGGSFVGDDVFSVHAVDDGDGGSPVGVGDGDGAVSVVVGSVIVVVFWANCEKNELCIENTAGSRITSHV